MMMRGNTAHHRRELARPWELAQTNFARCHAACTPSLPGGMDSPPKQPQGNHATYPRTEALLVSSSAASAPARDAIDEHPISRHYTTVLRSERTRTMQPMPAFSVTAPCHFRRGALQRLSRSYLAQT